jgi:hypothetical protein
MFTSARPRYILESVATCFTRNSCPVVYYEVYQGQEVPYARTVARDFLVLARGFYKRCFEVSAVRAGLFVFLCGNSRLLKCGS